MWPPLCLTIPWTVASPRPVPSSPATPSRAYRTGTSRDSPYVGTPNRVGVNTWSFIREHNVLPCDTLASRRPMESQIQRDGRGRRALVLRVSLELGCALSSAVGWAQTGAPEPQTADLTTLSLDQLMELKVTTASRQPERWWSAPNGIDVVTGDDIRRAGAQNLPDAMRLATGVHVGQPSARSWAISIRGMNVLAANKISVVMDGRSLFTPFFSGVLWDAQD